MTTQAVLFDLDGTLLDTAPSMHQALNLLRAELQLAPLPLQAIRGAVSHGSDAIITAGFADYHASTQRTPLPEVSLLKERFLRLYQDDIASLTCFFDGMENTIDFLETREIPWGIVTNKPGFLTFSLLDQLGLSARSGVTVCGDTTPFSKPNPLPLKHACEILGAECPSTIYVGDAERDIQAGRAAGMTTLVALFGYLSDLDQPSDWKADGSINAPSELLNWITLPPKL